MYLLRGMSHVDVSVLPSAGRVDNIRLAFFIGQSQS